MTVDPYGNEQARHRLARADCQLERTARYRVRKAGRQVSGYGSIGNRQILDARIADDVMDHP